jgi:hypothetical protein
MLDQTRKITAQHLPLSHPNDNTFSYIYNLDLFTLCLLEVITAPPRIGLFQSKRLSEPCLRPLLPLCKRVPSLYHQICGSNGRRNNKTLHITTALSLCPAMQTG